MPYQVIFTAAFLTDDETQARDFRGDVLLALDGQYYDVSFITLERVRNEFGPDQPCYMDETMVLLHEVNRASILAAAAELYRWQFQRRWQPVPADFIEQYYEPRSAWETVTLAPDALTDQS